MNDRLAGLSPRQLQCFRFVVRGSEAQEIGRSLGISDLTVKNRFSGARTVLGMARPIDAAQLAGADDSSLGQVADATDALDTRVPPGTPDPAYSDVQPEGRGQA